MRFVSILTSALVFSFFPVCCQKQIDTYKKAKEDIVELKRPGLFKSSRIIGFNKNLISMVLKDSLENVYLANYDERRKIFSIDDMVVLSKEKKIVSLVRKDSMLAISGFFKISKELADKQLSELMYDHQDLWLQMGNSVTKMDSFAYHFFDKHYEFKFSEDGNYLICNPFSDSAPGYEESEDGFIFLYDLRSGKVPNLKKKIKCSHCSNSFIFGRQLITQREIPIGHGFDGDYHNIYFAGIDNPDDTTLCAFNIKLLDISTDKKYILGKKYLYGRATPIILDVNSKHYQYLLGRDYPTDRCFYSTTKKKFAFDLGDQIVYVEIPAQFPFDALLRTEQFSSKKDDENFWAAYSTGQN
jgi:hypothetical protein